MVLDWLNELKLYILIGVVAAIGSLKAVVFTNKTRMCERVVDFFVGVVCGSAAGFYVAPDMGDWMACLVALFVATACILVLESTLTMIPSIVKKYVKNTIGVDV